MTKDEFNHYGVSISLKSNNSKLARIDRYNKSLFRLITLSSLLIYIICSVLFFKPGHASLSLSTRGTVEGSAPYFTLDNGKTKITKVSDLLRFSFKDDKGITHTINKETNTTSTEEPLGLPYSSIKTFADLEYLKLNDIISPNKLYYSLTYNDPLLNDYFRDDDGDELRYRAGYLTWQFYEGSFGSYTQFINADEKLNPCVPWYKMEFEATNFQIDTKYGNPNTNGVDYLGSPKNGLDKTTFYVRSEPSEPYVCWAAPNMSPHSYLDELLNQVVNGNGFLLQDINEPAKNFPTVGAHGLFFDLTYAGVSSKDISYTKQPSDSNISLDLSFKKIQRKERGLAILNVKLVGPKDGVSKTNASFKPTTFIIYAGTEKKEPIYSFTISKWFILKPGLGGNYESSEAYCNNIGYQIASVSDLTSSNRTEDPIWDKGLPGEKNYYHRRIGAGLLPEWGQLLKNYYKEPTIIPDGLYNVFWGREEAKKLDLISGHPIYYTVNDLMGGYIYYSFSDSENPRAMCVSP